MYRILLYISIQLLLCLSVQAAPKDSLRLEKRDGNTYIIHRVVKTETLASLAIKYGVAEAEILSANPLVSDKVLAGQLLKVPVNATKYGNVKAPEVKALTDSRLPLAQTLPTPTKANVTPEPPAPITAAVPQPTVIDFDSNKTILASAQQEIQPQPSGKPIASYKSYVVASPQTVQQVANSFSVDPNDIIIANKLKNYKLKEGQKIKIPIYGASATPTLAVAPVAKPKVEPPTPAPKPTPVPVSVPVPTPVVKTEPPAKPDLRFHTKPTTTAKLNNLQGDSITLLRKMRALARIKMLDSSYIHPDGIAYKVFNYKETNYQFDTYTLRLAEENAIPIQNTNQRPGYGSKDLTHAVKRGETLQSIARKYRVSATDLINWNGLLNYRVREGQELVINTSRADISPYERAMISNAVAKESTVLYQDVVKGLAFFDASKNDLGVYVNGVEKGKFIYLLNRDNYHETFARVMGPLPEGMPAGTVIYIGSQVARELKIDTESAHIEMWFGVFKDGQVEEEAKAE